MSTHSNEWVKFFTAAGIPSKYAAKYAAIFQEHRIQKDMLKDLNKEILSDMGIKTMGDVIAIMRQAKEVDEEETRAKVLGSHGDRSSPATMTGKPRLIRPVKLSGLEEASSGGLSTSLARRLGSGSVQGPSEVRRTVVQVDDVKKRISTPGITLSDRVVRLGTSTTSTSSSVFARLGGSSSSSSNASTITSGSVLRRTSGGEIALTSGSIQQAMKQTATVKPLKASSGSSLSARFASSHSSSTPYNIKDRLGGLKSESSPLLTLVSSNVRSKQEPAQKSNPKIIPLKKSIFDRLGS